MSQRYQAGIILPGYNALKVANAPTIGTATAGVSSCASVTFTAPACVGGGAISSYTVFANCGIKLTSGASSPLVVTGLTQGSSYTFKVIATNAYGPSYPSAASNSATIPIITCAAYTTAGTFSWVAPSGVTSVAVVAVGGGGGGSSFAGGGGGALAYANSISVTPGNSYSVIVGANGAGSSGSPSTAGGFSSFNSTSVKAGGAISSSCTNGGTVINGTGGAGGSGTTYSGGGGAGGYAGAGGDSPTWNTGSAGSGGAGGGGGGGLLACPTMCGGGGGGGVGIFGQGSNGSGGAKSTGGTGGSGGATGSSTGNRFGAAGALYGGGGGGGGWICCGATRGSGGGGKNGAVRIVWCSGGARGTPSFPSTNVGP